MSNKSVINNLGRISTMLSKSLDVIEICRNNNIIDSNALHSVFEEVELAAYNLGKILFDLDAESKAESSSTDNVDLNNLSFYEKRELSYYINKYCSNPDVTYSFERFGNGYRAVLPYLLNRRASKGKFYSPKKKYISNVFESLILSSQNEINPLHAASIIIISYSPYERQVIRDNDNVDSRDIINIINKYLLSTDDSGDLVNIVYTTKISDKYLTEVFILPYHDFVTDLSRLANT